MSDYQFFSWRTARRCAKARVGKRFPDWGRACGEQAQSIPTRERGNEEDFWIGVAPVAERDEEMRSSSLKESRGLSCPVQTSLEQKATKATKSESRG